MFEGIGGGIPPRSGDLYDSSMGDIRGGSVHFNWDGRRRAPGTFHHTVYGDGGRFSWNSYPDGGIGENHFTDPGYPLGDSRRHPFGG